MVRVQRKADRRGQLKPGSSTSTSGLSWLVLAGAGWSWLALACPGWSWLVLAGAGWSWLALACPGWSWLVLGGWTLGLGVRLKPA